MIELLKSKLKASNEFKEVTLSINELSMKTDYNKVNSLIDKRQDLIDEINLINNKISQAKNHTNYDTDEIKKIEKEISRIFIETYDIDNGIRKNINCELKSIKEKLNYPGLHTKSVNIKI